MVLLLKDCDYYLVQRSSQQDGSDKRAGGSVMKKTCGCHGGGHRSASCVDKTVDTFTGYEAKHTHTNKVIDWYS